MNDLKPCPFCGGKDSGILTTSYDEYWFAVFCERDTINNNANKKID